VKKDMDCISENESKPRQQDQKQPEKKQAWQTEMYNPQNVSIIYNEKTNIMTFEIKKDENKVVKIVINGKKGTISDENNNTTYKEITYESLLDIAQKNNLSDAERLKLAQGVGYTNRILDAGSKVLPGSTEKSTFCNMFAAYVTYLYTGSTALMGTYRGGELVAFDKTPAEVGYFRDPKTAYLWGYMSVSSSNPMNQMKYFQDNHYQTLTVADGLKIQELANRGILVYAVTPDHIALVSPGEGVYSEKKKLYRPAVAQQGRSRLLTDVTFKDGLAVHMGYAWRSSTYERVIFYYKLE